MRAAGQALREYMEQDTVLADLLGISAEELAAAKDDGSVRDLIEASGLTQEEIQAAMQEAYEAAVAQAVADGVITQEQADQLQEMPGRGGHGGPGGQRGGGHGHDGSRGGGQGNGSTTTPAVPNATNNSGV